jgi:electron transport complex protein RnfG
MSERQSSDQHTAYHDIGVAEAQDQQGTEPTTASSSAVMMRALGLIATICGLIIVSSYELTLDAVANNKKISTERAVFKVIPGASEVREFVATTGGIQPAGPTVPEGAVKFFGAYDKAGNLKGIAAEGVAKGYADEVRILYAYDPARQVITGMSVVTQHETPGIGDKVITDKDFNKNFEALDVKLADDMKAIANAIKVVKHGTKQRPWEIDAIAGTTVTSKAVGKGIRDSTEKLLPKLLPNVAKLKETK